jgi:hypothetical protein
LSCPPVDIHPARLSRVLSGEAAPQVPMKDVDWLYEDVVGKIKFLKEFQRWTGAA